MRVILIDPRERSVAERDVEMTLESLHELVEGYIEVACRFHNGDVLYVNEEGLFKFAEHFDVGAHQPFAGPGVIVGPENAEGWHQDARSSLEEIKAIIRFSCGPLVA